MGPLVTGPTGIARVPSDGKALCPIARAFVIFGLVAGVAPPSLKIVRSRCDRQPTEAASHSRVHPTLAAVTQRDPRPEYARCPQSLTDHSLDSPLSAKFPYTAHGISWPRCETKTVGHRVNRLSNPNLRNHADH